MADIKIIAPVVSIPVECALDNMIGRDTARRVAGALGFAPAVQAQIGSAALTLTTMLLKSGYFQELHFFGVREVNHVGIRMICTALWLRDQEVDRVTTTLHNCFGSLADQVEFHPGQEPMIVLTFWLKRKVQYESTFSSRSV